MALAPFNRSNDSWFGRPSLELFWDPFESFELAERSPARSLARDASAIASTRVDWLETADSHVFKAELPGTLARSDLLELFLSWNVVCLDTLD